MKGTKTQNKKNDNNKTRKSTSEKKCPKNRHNWAQIPGPPDIHHDHICYSMLSREIQFPAILYNPKLFLAEKATAVVENTMARF